MKGFFRNLFHLYPGEEKGAFLFACLAFLWALAISSGLKFADALFLIHVGPQSLPTTYIIIACLMFFVATLLLRSFHLAKPSTIFIAVLTAGISFYLLAFYCLSYDVGIENKWLWFALRIFGSAYFSVVITCFWTFVDQYHDLQDAKRLYSLFTSMIFLGIATTGAIMRSGLFEFKTVTLGIIGLLFFAMFWIKKIAREVKPVHEDQLEDYPSSSEQSLRSLFRSVLQSKFTLFLMLGNFLTYVLLVLTEYNYLSAFDARFHPGTQLLAGNEEHAKLTQFLGQWIAIVSVANLFFGLFIYSRLVKRFGSTSLLPVSALILLVTFSGWQISDALVFPLLGFLVVEGTLYVIDDSNFNLMLNAVPLKMKYKIRVIIESFFEPVGMLTSAALLSIPSLNSKIIGLVLSATLLMIAVSLQKRYFKAIYSNLTENAIHFQRTFADWFRRMNQKQKKSTEYRLLGMLKLGDEEAQILAAEGILGMNNPALLRPLMREADKLSPQGKNKFIKLVETTPFAGDATILDHIHKWSHEEGEPELKQTLQFYLLIQGMIQECSPHHIESLFEHLKEDNPRVKRAAALAIAQIADKRCLPYANDLIALLKSSKDSEVRTSCLKALGKIGEPSLIPDLIAASTHFRPGERRLTEQLISNMGQSSIPILLELTKDTALNDRCRLLAGRTLGLIALPDLRAHLAEIIQVEIERAYFYSYHYKTLQPPQPDIDLTVLRESLLSSYHSVLDFIVQLLGVAGEIEDCELLSRSMRSSNPKIRSQVIETLEKTCEPKIYRLLYPLVVDIPEEEKRGAYLKGGRTALSFTELLDKLSHSASQLDQIMAAAYQHRFVELEANENRAGNG